MSLEECERIAFPTRCYHLHPLQSESRPPAPDHSLSRQQYATAPCQCDPSVSGLPHFQSAFEPRKHDRPYYLPLHMHGEAFCPTHRWRSYQHCGSVVPGRILCSRTLQPDAERIDRRTLIEHGVDLVMSTLLDDAATFPPRRMLLYHYNHRWRWVEEIRQGSTIGVDPRPNSPRLSEEQSRNPGSLDWLVVIRRGFRLNPRPLGRDSKARMDFSNLPVAGDAPALRVLLS